MQFYSHSWTLLALFCSVFTVGTEIILPVKHDMDAISKGTIDGDWTNPVVDDSDITGKDEDSRNSDIRLNANTIVDKQGRYKRKALFSDSGYGSRLTAGSNIAHDYLALKKVFGNVGPGKRSDIGVDFYKRKLYKVPKLKPKRDYEYDSWLRAGDSMANSMLARKRLYGTFRRGRRYDAAPFSKNSEPFSNMDVDGGNVVDWSAASSDILGDALSGTEETNEETDDGGEVEKRRLVSDSGYSSRIDAANDVAADLAAVHDVFGMYGPGKR